MLISIYKVERKVLLEIKRKQGLVSLTYFLLCHAYFCFILMPPHTISTFSFIKDLRQLLKLCGK